MGNKNNFGFSDLKGHTQYCTLSLKCVISFYTSQVYSCFSPQSVFCVAARCGVCVGCHIGSRINLRCTVL